MRAVESERGEQLARSQGIPFLETSAKTGHNIDEVRGHLMMSLWCHAFEWVFYFHTVGFWAASETKTKSVEGKLTLWTHIAY